MIIAYPSVQAETIKILERLRRCLPEKVLIRDLLDEYEGRVPHHTGAGIFGSSITSLLDAGFIRLISQDGRDISEEVARLGDPDDWSYGRGYEVAAKALRGKEEEVSAMLTQRLSELQSLLGVSLTDLHANIGGNGMTVRPMFGRPSGRPKSDVFVLMPFHESLAPVYDDHIKKVCANLGVECERADNLFGSSNIINDIWELICNSEIIIADCTSRNPNVFYELGIAHTLGKVVIIITQNPDDIPFDIRHIRYIRYQYTPRGMQEFEATLREYLLSARRT